MPTLLIKPLLDLWVLEHGDTESGDNRNGDDDA
jgi:glucose/arabinose dehydrogenase